MAVYPDLMGNDVELTLPREVLQVENHFSWMVALIPYIDPGRREGPYTMEEHLRQRSERLNLDGQEVFIDLSPEQRKEKILKKYNSESPEYCLFYAVHLNRAVQLAYLGDYDDALSRLNHLDVDEINSALEVHHKQALDYAVDALKWAIKKLRIQREGTDESNLESPDHFLRRWDQLQRNDHSMAVIKFLTAKFGSSLNIVEKRLLEIYQEALSLDPGHHVWYTVVYRTLRGLRRNAERQMTGRLEPPSDLEVEMCEKAYKWEPTIYSTIKNRAVLIKDKLAGMQGYWPRRDYLDCKTLSERALGIARKIDQNEWKLKALIYLFELLLDTRANSFNHYEQGMELLHECRTTYPRNSGALHKIAKIYQYNRRCRNSNRAKEVYQQAINADPNNYPCVKDYLKLLAFERMYTEYIDACDRSLQLMTKDYTISGLYILKGCVLWLFNPFDRESHREEACDSWLEVYSRFPRCRGALRKDITSPPFRDERRQRLTIETVIEVLVGMRGRCISGEQDDRINLITACIDWFNSREDAAD